jgi:hypothetical protein
MTSYLNRTTIHVVFRSNSGPEAATRTAKVGTRISLNYQYEFHGAEQ